MLSGTWVGEVESVTPWHSRMIVESLNGNSARIVYAHSGHHNDPRVGGPPKTAQCHCAPGWGRITGAIDQGRGDTTLRFMTPTGMMSLKVATDRPDLMAGHLARKNGSYPVKMKRLREGVN